MTLDCTKLEGSQNWLQYGSKGALVTELQTLLQKHGYYKGFQVDGDFKQKTKEAVGSFQSKNGLQKDYKVGPATCKKLNGVTETTNVVGFDCPNIYFDTDRNNDINLVKKLQNGLKKLGYYTTYKSGKTTKEYKVDGIYGTYTKQAVAAFQRTVGLSPDGVFGPKTCPEFNKKLGWTTTTTKKTTTKTVVKKKAKEIVIDTGKANYIVATNPHINFTVDGVYFIATDISPSRSFESADWQVLDMMGDKTYTYLGHSQPIEYDITVKLHKDHLEKVTPSLQQMMKKVCNVTGKSIIPGKYVMNINTGYSTGDWRTISFHLLQYRG